MNENAKKWVAALRSGKYKQGTAVLHNVTRGTHCCLGVACDLYAQEHPELLVEDEVRHQVARSARPDGESVTVVRTYGGATAALPKQVQRWLGLSTYHGAFYKKGVSTGLVTYNDSGRFDFDAIADIIESEPAGLFK